MDDKPSSKKTHPSTPGPTFISDARASNSNATHTQPAQNDATLLAQFDAAIGQLNQSLDNPLPQHTTTFVQPIPHFYNNLMQNNVMQPQQPFWVPLGLPWNPLLPFQSPHQPQAGPIAYGQSPTTMNTNALGNTNTMGGQDPPYDATATATPAVPPEVELAVAEEKRIRNGAASARFRIKKKHRTLTLERSVTDLTERAEELEREVADLRRENGWLKEIVLMKGAQYAASYREALQNAAILAAGGQAGSTAGGPSSQRPTERIGAGSEDEEDIYSSEEEDLSSTDHKGKRRAKDKKK